MKRTNNIRSLLMLAIPLILIGCGGAEEESKAETSSNDQRESTTKPTYDSEMIKKPVFTGKLDSKLTNHENIQNFFGLRMKQSDIVEENLAVFSIEKMWGPVNVDNGGYAVTMVRNDVMNNIVVPRPLFDFLEIADSDILDPKQIEKENVAVLHLVDKDSGKTQLSYVVMTIKTNNSLAGDFFQGVSYKRVVARLWKGNFYLPEQENEGLLPSEVSQLLSFLDSGFLQSYGTQSKHAFTKRVYQNETHGVVGLIGNAGDAGEYADVWKSDMAFINGDTQGG